MKQKFGMLGLLGLFLPALSLAQQPMMGTDNYVAGTEAANSGLIFIALLFYLLVVLGIYVYCSFTLYVMAKHVGIKDPWYAWVPIVNLIVMIQIAKSPSWWFLLLLIPIVNIITVAVVWMRISKAVGQPDWLGLLILVPFINIILPGYLAYASTKLTPAQPTPPSA